VRPDLLPHPKSLKPHMMNTHTHTHSLTHSHTLTRALTHTHLDTHSLPKSFTGIILFLCQSHIGQRECSGHNIHLAQSPSPHGPRKFCFGPLRLCVCVCVSVCVCVCCVCGCVCVCVCVRCPGAWDCLAGRFCFILQRLKTVDRPASLYLHSGCAGLPHPQG